MAPDLIIDMRCLQDPAEAERGIAAHAGAVVRLARQVSAWARAARIVGLIDPRMPALPADIAARADEIRSNAYMPSPPPGSLLLNPSPMAPDQDVLGRLLLDPRIAKAAIVYDFIPLDQPAQYLTDPISRLSYGSALVWLRRYGLFLPISAPAEARLREILPTAARTFVTGVPITLFDGEAAVPPVVPRHILTVGGADPRKNPEVLIRAHAGSPYLQNRRVPLLISGNYTAEWRQDLKALAARAGGDPDLVRVPGRVGAAALREAYRAAYCVITPSRAEGFSLPVVEAMAAGVASLASDIPAHAVLLPDPAWRFDPDDAPALAHRLETLVENPQARGCIVAAQAEIWPPFKTAEVAAKVWSAVEELAAPAPQSAPVVRHGHRPRVAYMSPLPPARTGVADFSARLAEALSKRAELELFSAHSRSGGAAPGSGQPFLSGRFDRVIAALGNSEHFLTTHKLLLRYGCACICHDARMLGFSLNFFGAAATARLASRELGRIVTAAQVMEWAQNETSREADLLDDVAAAARPLIFHNRHSAAALAARGRGAEYLPFPIYRPWSEPPVSAAGLGAARRRLGLPETGRLIASFGFVAKIKGVEPALAALALLRERSLRCHLLWVGDASETISDMRRGAAAHGVTDLVTFHTAFFTEAQYRDYLLAADYGLQLRIGRPGSVSGALQDCIAAGLPSVANDDLADNLDAPEFIRRVGDELDAAAIAEAFAGLIAQGLPRDAHEEARRAYCALHSMDNYVTGLFRLLEL